MLLFGGESTVLFDSNMALTGGKGGRNQELVLSLFHSLLSDDFVNFFKSVGDTEFAFFSLGTDGLILYFI